MMGIKKHFQLLLICLLIFFSCDQKKKLGLVTKGTTVSSDDSLHIENLRSAGNKIAWSHPDSAILLYRKALAQSYNINYPKGIATNLNALGILDINRSHFPEALSHFNEELRFILNNLPVDSAALGILYNNMALLYSKVHQQAEAITYYTKAHDIAVSLKKWKLAAMTANNKGAVLSDIGEKNKAKQYLDKAKEIALLKEDAITVLPLIYLNESNIYRWKKEYDYALEKCVQSIELAQSYNDVGCKYDAMRLMGQIFEEKGNPAKAIETYNKISSMVEDNPSAKMRADMLLGKVYLGTGEFKKSLAHLNAALNQAELQNGTREMVSIHEYFSELYRKTKEFEAAYNHKEKSVILKDSLLHLENFNTVSLLEVKYQTEQKNKKIAESKLLIAKQQNVLVKKNVLIWSIGLGAMLLLVGLTYVYYNRQRLEKHKRNIAIWQALSEGEEKERNRIARDLHDGLGGLLTTLKMQHLMMAQYVPQVKATDLYFDTQNLLDTTITEIRKTAHNLMPELLLRHGLAEAVSLFCRGIAENNLFTVDFQYYGLIEEFDNNFQLAVFRIIQELVHNAVKHANASEILVQLSRHNEILEITVEDNGVGFDTSTKVEGLGIQSISSRVTELNGRFHIRSKANEGTAANIEFILKKGKNNI